MKIEEFERLQKIKSEIDRLNHKIYLIDSLLKEVDVNCTISVKRMGRMIQLEINSPEDIHSILNNERRKLVSELEIQESMFRNDQL